MRRRRRVAITGIGAVTPIGIGAAALRAGVLRGRSAVRRLTRFDAEGYGSQIAAEVDGFDALQYLDARRAKRLDRFSQFAVAAARLALCDAELPDVPEGREDAGVHIGSALGGVAFAEQQHAGYLRRGTRVVSPFLALSVFGGAAACNVAIELRLRGPVLANSNSCASGAVAIGEAFRLIRAGQVDAMLAGGAECPLAPLTFGAFDIIRAMSTRNDEPERACRPFDCGRDGFVMAEGAAVLLLEERQAARARGARVYAEVLGYGLTNDAFHMAAPLPTGAQAARAMRLALEDAGVEPRRLDYVNAHGSSTPLNDPIEARAMRAALGAAVNSVPVSSTKPLHGHALGATAAIEAAICAQSIHYGHLPPSVNLDDPDPACDLCFVPPDGLSARARFVLTNSFGFGGINACLVFCDPEYNRDNW